MIGPDGLEERTAYYDEVFAGTEYDLDYDQALTVEPIPPITIRPVSTEGLEDQARKMLKRMAEES